MVDVHRTIGSWRCDHAFEVLAEERGVLLALCGPARELRQLHPSDRRMDVGHARVEADNLVLVAPLHALVAEQRATRASSVEPVVIMPPSPDVMFFVG